MIPMLQYQSNCLDFSAEACMGPWHKSFLLEIILAVAPLFVVKNELAHGSQIVKPQKVPHHTKSDTRKF